MREERRKCSREFSETVNRELWSGTESQLVKDPCHFGCTEHVCDALEVVCHCRESHFSLRAGQSTQQETRRELLLASLWSSAIKANELCNQLRQFMRMLPNQLIA